MTIALTSTGLTIERLATIKDDLEDAWRAAFGEAVNLDEDTPEGQIIALMSKREALVQELLEAVYNSVSVDNAEGTSLDNVGTLAGLPRLAASKTQVTVTFTGTAGTTIPAGTRVAVTSTGELFETIAEDDIEVGGTVDIVCRAVNTGPILAPATSVTTIETPVGGLDSVTNAADHSSLGSNVESDTAYRIRIKQLRQAPGGGGVTKISQAIAAVEGVTAVVVFENETASTDAEGRAAHTVHAVVAGGSDADVAQAIWDTKAAGIATHGSTSVNVTDGAEGTQAVLFDRPSDVRIYCEVDITTDPEGRFPADGAQQVENAIIAYSDDLTLGRDVVVLAIQAAVFAVGGVRDVVVRLGTSPSPTATSDIVVAPTAQADIDSADITIAVDP